MKLSRLIVTLFGAVLLFAAGTFAADINKGTLHLTEKVSVQGKELAPGKYTVQWEGTGPTVQVNIRKGKETVATVPAHMVEQATRNYADAYGSETQPDGSKSLTAIYLGGKNFSLELGQEANQQSSTNSSK
jgi:hypothetical protein